MSISLSKASEVSDELFIPEIMENKKEDYKAIETGIFLLINKVAACSLSVH